MIIFFSETMPAAYDEERPDDVREDSHGVKYTPIHISERMCPDGFCHFFQYISFAGGMILLVFLFIQNFN